MDTRRTARVTAAERAAWAAAGALATVAALAGLAVHWGRAVEKNEQYGTWQGQPDDAWNVWGRLGPAAWSEATEGVPERQMPEPENEAALYRPERYERLRDAARTNWHRETRQVGPPLRVEPYRPEGT